MRSALAEVSDRIPAPAVAGEGSGAAGAPPAAGAVPAALLAEGLSRLEVMAASGSAPAAAGLAVIARTAGPADRAAAEARLAGRPAPEALYALAFEADAAGAAGEAVLILGLLAGSEAGETEGFLGLSVIACRRRLFAQAKALADRCLEAESRHPRALSVAGICALESGDMATAQSYLAAAARLARANPAFRQDLQAAQRALILMHLSS